MNDPLSPVGRSRPRARRGFTLIELVITIALATILMTLAAPSMIKMTKINRVQTEASSFVSDLMLARTEAVKRGQSVSVCITTAGSSCLTGNAWNQGWMVFLDTAAGCTLPSGVSAIKVRSGFSGSDTLTGPTTSTNCVTFNREGFTSNLGASAVTFTLHTSDSLAQATRCVQVDLGGHITTETTGQGSCT